ARRRVAAPAAARARVEGTAPSARALCLPGSVGHTGAVVRLRIVRAEDSSQYEAFAERPRGRRRQIHGGGQWDEEGEDRGEEGHEAQRLRQPRQVRHGRGGRCGVRGAHGCWGFGGRGEQVAGEPGDDGGEDDEDEGEGEGGAGQVPGSQQRGEARGPGEAGGRGAERGWRGRGRAAPGRDPAARGAASPGFRGSPRSVSPSSSRVCPPIVELMHRPQTAMSTGICASTGRQPARGEAFSSLYSSMSLCCMSSGLSLCFDRSSLIFGASRLRVIPALTWDTPTGMSTARTRRVSTMTARAALWAPARGWRNEVSVVTTS